MNSQVIYAPNVVFPSRRPKIFLAGSIEMGKAEDWQTRLINDLSDLKCIFLNPRRKDWDSSWEQKIENPQFNEQVTWELRGLERCDIIAMYFSPGTQSPISLLEFGLYAHTDKLIVCCPEGFWRKGNVDITAKHYRKKVFNNFEEFQEQVRKHIVAAIKEYEMINSIK